MTNTPTLPTYSEINQALKKTTGKFSAAQTHGLFCGLICGTSGKDKHNWEHLFFTDEKNSATLTALQQLFEISYHLLSEFSFEFTLLLPTDDKDIHARAEALGLWCQGFLSGLKQTHVRITQREPGEITEALNDIIEIAQINHEDIATSDDDESAYFELVEYVRLTTLMIFHELKSKTMPKSAGKTDLLH